MIQRAIPAPHIASCTYVLDAVLVDTCTARPYGGDTQDTGTCEYLVHLFAKAGRGQEGCEQGSSAAVGVLR